MFDDGFVPGGLASIVDSLNIDVEEEDSEEEVDVSDLEKEFLNPTHFLEVSSVTKRSLRKSLSKRHMMKFRRTHHKRATKKEEASDPRAYVFNLFAVSDNMHYVGEEESDNILENVAVDLVDVFDLYSELYMFSSL